jgi:predicted ester cyclase
MGQAEKNRQFILKFYQAVSGEAKTGATLHRFTSDPKLIEHVLFFESLFPKYELIADEITCEEDRVIVRARARGKHTGRAEGIPPTYRVVETPFVIGYRVENEVIIDHWFIADQIELLEQLQVPGSQTQ